MKRFFLQSVVFLTLIMAQIAVFAAELPDTAKQIPDKKVVGSAPDILAVFLGLFAVIALILLLAFFLKRFNPAMLQKNSPLKVLASQSLGPRERIVLVAVGEQQLLLGVTAQQVSLLHTLPEPLVLPETNQSPFASQLQDVLMRRGN
jgi:flagellar protein FliO/FliZ